MNGRIGAAFALLLAAAPARAANLDVTASYKMRAVSYENLDLNSDKAFQNNHAFISNDARLGVAVRKIALETRGLEETTMDVGVTLHALGLSGSSNTLRTEPFRRAADNYPSANFTPFIENAYLRVYRFMGHAIDTTFGRQNYRLGSGLLLDDDGAGLNGITVGGELPWWSMKLEGFVFADRNVQQGGDSSLTLFGATLNLPSEGVWQLNQLFERDRGEQQAFGCSFSGMDPALGCRVSKALRSFSSIRYTLNYGPVVFDGEAALQKGAATPTGTVPAPNHITYNGNAEVARAKWKQRLPRLGEGIARMSLARGSGDDSSTPTTDEAFFPSRGHRFNGLERSGFGEFFGATVYDAYGGNYSSTSANGLAQGASGIIVVGAGFTPPAYKDVVLDADYYLFQADRVHGGSRTLGSEWDLRLRYNVQDRFGVSLTGAWFTAGYASNPAKAKARKYVLEAYGRF
ncbi:MAG: hypothetical protein PHF00_09260 [Elusimicrobia bacterium]|nr:hypothetical protein [Elusimicrobiota bacterium]